MENPENLQTIDQAFDQIEKVILPGIAILLDSLLDAAALARSGTGERSFPAELRILTLQLETVTRQVEMLSLAKYETGAASQSRTTGDLKISA